MNLKFILPIALFLGHLALADEPTTTYSITSTVTQTLLTPSESAERAASIQAASLASVSSASVASVQSQASAAAAASLASVSSVQSEAYASSMASVSSVQAAAYAASVASLSSVQHDHSLASTPSVSTAYGPSSQPITTSLPVSGGRSGVVSASSLTKPSGLFALASHVVSSSSETVNDVAKQTDSWSTVLTGDSSSSDDLAASSVPTVSSVDGAAERYSTFSGLCLTVFTLTLTLFL
ncbi:unnamed protein product [Ambrosiozyma monospora]|uniref:Unnamed protein product n=1 Tax=Ambrosiozyma monospora TaxID=43982 RepID=A0ACB5TAN3_AMBMO|nr:unnamed protein product [Ambrosiozyma monospora]